MPGELHSALRESGNAEWWVMRIVRAHEPDHHNYVMVNGDRCEPIQEYGTEPAAAARALSEASLHPGQVYKIVLNADPNDLIGQVLK